MEYEVIIIGAGVAGLALARELRRQRGALSLALIDANASLPACSLRSLGTLALFGITPGFGPRGDELWQAWQLLPEIYRPEDPGVMSCRYFKTVDDPAQKEAFVARYGPQLSCGPFPPGITFSGPTASCEGLLIDPPQLLSFWRSQLAGVHWVSSTVQALRPAKEGVVLTTGAGEFCARSVVWCGGSYHLAWSERPLKNKSGAVWARSVKPCYDESWAWETPHGQLVYRHRDHRVLLASGELSEPWRELAPEAPLRESLQYFKARVPALAQALDFSRGEVVLGHRSKAPQRRPQLELLYQRGAHKVLAIHGLYKNGWSLAPWMARRCVRELYGTDG